MLLYFTTLVAAWVWVYPVNVVTSSGLTCIQSLVSTAVAALTVTMLCFQHEAFKEITAVEEVLSMLSRSLRWIRDDMYMRSAQQQQ
jgi:hypothetical protein